MDTGKVLEMIDVALESRIGRKVFPVTHVLAENRPAFVCQREPHLELAPEGKRWASSRSAAAQVAERSRAIAGRKALAPQDPCHRIVAAEVDRPVMDQEQVRNSPQPPQFPSPCKRRREAQP